MGATDGCPIPFRASRLDLPIPGRFTLVFLQGFQDVGIQIDSRLISKSGALSVFATNMAAGVAAAFAKLILKLFSETELDDFRMRNLECLLAHQMERSNARC